jgi:hypothetical protein
MKNRWKPFSPHPKNNIIQHSEGNENGYLILDSNKIKISDAKEPNEAHENTRKKKSCK